ncbi:MAG: aspartyl-tRNA(Asn)/glutamyl-tRNA(Gln) amidotransferase subunit B [Phycisphaerales bacterium]|jgi:aspartyl-tRNA(Asn)/glutamyl-tRNA(Gln) amidotransferase subunit B
MSTQTYTVSDIESVRPIIGMEVHVELATRTKMFTRAPSPAYALEEHAAPNTLIDPVVLGLPGALPVMNEAAVELSVLVGLALGCSIAKRSKWDRKNYFYPDLPKAYQISQYDLPLCFDGAVDVPAPDADGEPDPDGATTRIGIIRAHLEEDAGKLMHELPAEMGGVGGGGVQDGSIVDLNRAGTPLLEIVTAPDFTSAEQCVSFAKLLRHTCRHLGATLGVMQRGHMRFEPNINCEIVFADGHTVRTPITEVKNLNSFKALAGAVEYELREQPKRFVEDGLVMGPGAKTTRGWDDAKLRTTMQREKEDAHDYRYFPDPDLLPVVVSDEWRERIRGRMCELPMARQRRYKHALELSARDARTLAEERPVGELFDDATDAAVVRGIERNVAAKGAANILLQVAMKIANARAQEAGTPVLVSELGLSAAQVAAVVWLRHEGKVSSNAADELVTLMTTGEHAGADAEELAGARGLLIVRDDAQLGAWCDEVIAANESIAEQIRGGKPQAVGRLIGEVVKKAQASGGGSGGAVDAKDVREELLKRIG